MDRSRPRTLAAITILLVVIASSGLLSACGENAEESQLSGDRFAPVTYGAQQKEGLPRLEPAEGVYFGVNLDWSNDSAAAFNDRLGNNAAVYVQFVRFPFSTEEKGYLVGFFEQVGAQGGIALLTLEPAIPLEQIDAALADELARYLAGVAEQYDVAIMVRFAHEMNGSWYSWSQQPETYVAAFRTIAQAVHHTLPEAAMIWAPNHGAGYPFAGGPHEAKPGSPGFQLLDTNGDMQLNMRDDPYSPYYPGDDVVDWVGISLYHWGSAWPWGENEIPEANKFVDHLTGNYQGFNGDERDVPDFYQLFAEDRGKPLAIVETAALFNPEAGRSLALEIKRAWWNQVFNAEVREQFPQIKMINWFEWNKFETEVGGRLDWTLTRDATIRAAFLEDFENEAYLFAPLR